MAQNNMTADQVTDADMELFSDMFKECYGYRPRFQATKQDYADLANKYDDIQETNRQEEQAALDRLSEQHGIKFASWSEYYEWDIKDQKTKFEAAKLAKQEQEAVKKVGIKNVIDRWEHGERVA